MLVVILMIASSFAVSAGSFSLSSSASPLEGQGGNNIISTNSSMVAGSYRFDDLTITAGTTLILKNDVSLTGFKGVELVVGNLTVENGGMIASDGQGYGSDAGPGHGLSGVWEAGGGGHGGVGGTAVRGEAGGSIYDSSNHPIEPGSGGAYEAYYTSRGGSGGGAMKLIVTGTLHNDGSISADGNISVMNGGGGSGGSILVIADDLQGAGIFSATGGNAIGFSGGGGGGRVAIHFNSSTFQGTTDVTRGAGYGSAGNGTAGLFDEVKDILTVDSEYRFQENDGTYYLKRIALIDRAVARFQGEVDLYTDELLLLDNSTITTDGFESQRGKVHLRIGNLTIDRTSSIDLNGKGFNTSEGPGGAARGLLSVGGAGYGGKGGANYVDVPGGGTYGSAIEPTDRGSGGGYDGYWQNPGGSGGGAVRIEVADEFRMDGSISVNGNNAPAGSGGGGSGGSIFVIAGSISGNGTFSAWGGDGGLDTRYASSLAGGGGGGRIALYYDTNWFNGSIDVRGGIGAHDGGAGSSIVLQGSPGVQGDLYETGSSMTTVLATLNVTAASMSNASVVGTMSGQLDLSSMTLVQIVDGDFSGQGFISANWQATLDGVMRQGMLNGTVGTAHFAGKLSFRGTTSGGAVGTLEGTLSTSGGNKLDIFQGVWRLAVLDDKAYSGTLSVQGSMSYGPSATYPATELQVLQSTMSGPLRGYNSDNMSVTLTEILVNSTLSPYRGMGFSYLSYTCGLGTGEGWSYDAPSTQGTKMGGSFSSPLLGIFTGELMLTGSGRKMSFSVQRLDLAANSTSYVRVELWGPESVSPGQTVSYVIEYRNDGGKDIGNISIVFLPAMLSKFVSGSAGYRYDPVIHAARWDMMNVPAHSTGYLFAQVTITWGLSADTQLPVDAFAMTINETDDMFEHESLEQPAKQDLANAAMVYLSSLTVEPNPVSENVSMTLDRSVFALFYARVQAKAAYATEQGQGSGGYWKEMSSDLKVMSRGKPGYLFTYGGYTQDGSIPEPSTLAPSASTMATDMVVPDSNNFNSYTPGGIAIAQATFYSFVNVMHSGNSDKINQAVTNYPMYAGYENYEDWDTIFKPQIDVVVTTTVHFSNYDPSTGNVHVVMNTVMVENGQVIGTLKIDQNTTNLYETALQAVPHISNMINNTIQFHANEQWLHQQQQSYWNLMNEIDTSNQGGGNGSGGSGGSIFWHLLRIARDPNMMTGPEGNVSAGQRLEYRIECENVGNGTAYGVYFTDVLPEALDASSLTIGTVHNVTSGVQIAGAGTYEPATRTITWQAGELGPKEGGYTNISINVKSDAPEGTVIVNFATVYFPSVPERTLTNAIVSTIGIPVVKIGGPYSGAEGTEIKFNASASYSQNGNPLTYRWDFDGDGIWDTNASANPFADHTYAGPWSGWATVQGDDGKMTVTDSCPVQVRNVAPILKHPGNLSFNGKHLSIQIEFGDPGKGNHTAVIDFGDGSNTTFILLGSALVASLEHDYAASGEYTVNVTIFDEHYDGGFLSFRAGSKDVGTDGGSIILLLLVSVAAVGIVGFLLLRRRKM
jgi:uncharacterized repeat protein (TIGR01451 family)